jgi:hypothetical protein
LYADPADKAQTPAKKIPAGRYRSGVAADRELWTARDPDRLAALRQVYLETEGDLEGDEG